MASAVRLREDIRLRSFERWPSGRRTSTRAGGFWRCLRSGTAWTGARRRRSAGWTARRYVSGSIASTGRVWALVDNWTKGPEPRLSAVQLAQLAQIVVAGPNREKDGVMRWRRIDLKRVIAERFGVDFHPRDGGKATQETRLLPHRARPYHPARDERTVGALKKTSRAR